MSSAPGDIVYVAVNDPDGPIEVEGQVLEILRYFQGNLETGNSTLHRWGLGYLRVYLMALEILIY